MYPKSTSIRLALARPGFVADARSGIECA